MNGGSLHVNPGNAKEGSTVTVTVIPDEGYTLERLTVTDEDGNAIQTTDTGGGKYTFTMPDSKVMQDASFAVREATATGVHFLNVPSGAYYADTVVWAVEQGIAAGTSATAFSPRCRSDARADRYVPAPCRRFSDGRRERGFRCFLCFCGAVGRGPRHHLRYQHYNLQPG